MVVSRWAKSVAWFGIFLLNLFFIYFSMLRGLQRGYDWQLMYLTACVVQFVIEILFYETSECAIIHYLIPDLARNEIQSVQFVLHKSIESLWIDVPAGHELPLNAPDYLFVSTRLANAFPNLLESMVVRSYFTYSPGELSKKWKISHFSLSSPLSRMSWSQGRVRRFTVTALTTALLQYLGALSPTLQRVMIHSMQPLVLSAMYFVFDLMLRNPFYFLPFGALVFYVGYRIFEEKYRRGTLEVEGANEIHPLTSTPSPSLSAELPSDNVKKEPKIPEEVEWESEDQAHESSFRPSSSDSDIWLRGDNPSKGKRKPRADSEDFMLESEISDEFSFFLNGGEGLIMEDSVGLEGDDEDSFDLSDSDGVSDESLVDADNFLSQSESYLSSTLTSQRNSIGVRSASIEIQFDGEDKREGQEEARSLSDSSESW